MRGRVLVGACQRDISQHFPQLAALVPPSATSPSSSSEDETEGEAAASSTTAVQLVKQAIAKFHRLHVREAFPLQDCGCTLPRE